MMGSARLPIRFQVLATYNAEVARGIVHTESWHDAMAELQGEYYDWQNANVAVAVANG